MQRETWLNQGQLYDITSLRVKRKRITTHCKAFRTIFSSGSSGPPNIRDPNHPFTSFYIFHHAQLAFPLVIDLTYEALASHGQSMLSHWPTTLRAFMSVPLCLVQHVRHCCSKDTLLAWSNCFFDVFCILFVTSAVVILCQAAQTFATSHL